MAEKYFLMPDCSVGKLGLPNGKLSVKKDGKPLEIKPELVKVLEKNLPYLISAGKVLTGTKLDEIEAKASESGKSEKRTALEAEATELGIEFNTKTSGKMLEDMIESEKAKPDPETGE